MVTSWQLYWITRLDSICTVFVILSALLSISVIIAIAYGLIENHEENRFKPLKILILIFLCILIPAILIPTTKEAVAIYILPKIINNENVQQLPDNTAKFLNEKLQEWISDTLEHKKEKK